MVFTSTMYHTLSNYGRQLAFSIAPLPAYLPQYYSLCASSNDPFLERKVHSPYATTSRSGHSPDFGAGLSLSISTPHSHGHFHNPHQIKESGFSSTSIMILLMSHVLRLQYFLGSAVINTFSEHPNSADKVHYDLVTQSIVMIAMQLMLLSAVTRRRRMTTKIKADDEQPYPHANEATPQISMLSPRSSSLSQRPFIWLLYPRRYWQWDTVHQYVELVIVLTILTYLFFRMYMYPNDFLKYISSVKVLSVLLESCLALPQMILNYKLQSTEGLSLVMVLGWVIGDLLKLVYFMIGSGVIKAGHEVSKVVTTVSEKSPEQSEEMTVFILGCVFALVMDTIVGLQVTKYYPSKHMIMLKERFRSIEQRVLQIDYGYSASSSSSTSMAITVTAAAARSKDRRGSMDAIDMTTC